MKYRLRERINSLASEGEESLERTAQQIEELRSSIKQLAEVVSDLEASSSEIDKIVNHFCDSRPNESTFSQCGHRGGQAVSMAGFLW